LGIIGASSQGAVITSGGGNGLRKALREKDSKVARSVEEGQAKTPRAGGAYMPLIQKIFQRPQVSRRDGKKIEGRRRKNSTIFRGSTIERKRGERAGLGVIP